MPNAITNTSPLVYLYRVGAIEWLPKLFSEIWVPNAVIRELQEGIRLGHDVLNPDKHTQEMAGEAQASQTKSDEEELAFASSHFSATAGAKIISESITHLTWSSPVCYDCVTPNQFGWVSTICSQKGCALYVETEFHHDRNKTKQSIGCLL